LGGASTREPAAQGRNGATRTDSASPAQGGHTETAGGALLSGDAIAADAAAVTASAVRTAHAVHERARAQQRQIARLRRGDGPHGAPPVRSVPFLFRSELDFEAIQRIADRLARDL
jgi:hypothetical protein